MTEDEIRKERKYFESMNELFSSEGWRHFVENVNSELSTLNNLSNCNTPEDLWYHKGQLAILTNIQNLQDAVQRSSEAFEEEYPEDPR